MESLTHLSDPVNPRCPLPRLFLKGCWEISKRMRHVLSQLWQKKKRKADSKSHLLKRLRGQPKKRKKKNVLKMAAGFKGKHICGGGIRADMKINSKVKGERSHGTKERKERATGVHCIQQRKRSHMSYVLFGLPYIMIITFDLKKITCGIWTLSDQYVTVYVPASAKASNQSADYSLLFPLNYVI